MIRWLRWPLAGGAIVATHLALANWLMVQASLGERVTAPEPIVVDLQPAPQPEVQPDVAPEAELQPEPEPAAEPEPEPAPEPEPDTVATPSFTPPPMTQLPALADPADLFPPITSSLALAQSQRPQTKPQPKRRMEARQERQPAAEPQRTEPRRQATPAAAQPAAPAAQPATQPQKHAAPAGPGPREIANWQAQIGNRISRHMAKTNVSGRGQIAVQIAVTIGPNGATAAQLVSSTGDARMDQALARQAGRMPRMPAPPGGQSQSFVLPVAFRAR